MAPRTGEEEAKGQLHRASCLFRVHGDGGQLCWWLCLDRSPRSVDSAAQCTGVQLRAPEGGRRPTGGGCHLQRLVGWPSAIEAEGDR